MRLSPIEGMAQGRRGAVDHGSVRPARPCLRARLAFAFASAFVLAGCAPLTALAADFQRDRTPLPANVSGAGKGATPSVVEAGGSGGAAVRMLLGLAIVIAIIFGLYKLLKRSADRNDRTVGAYGPMTVVASTPLAQSRALHLVQVGDELVLVGSSEQGVTRIRVYGADEARRLGFERRNDLPSLPASGARPSFGSALIESLRKRTAR